MKKRSILIAILCVLSCFSLMFSACESGENTGGTIQGEATQIATNEAVVGATEKPSDETSDNIVITDTYTREGEYIYFGTYPQSEVTDSSLKSTLNGLAGTLPSSSNSQGWISYNYYIESSNATDFMWYKDISHGGETYRGVYFTSYKPYFTSNSSSSGVSYQDDNGYNTGTVYWFEYEPIKWKILTENSGKAFLLCEMLLDSQAYQNCYKYDGDGNYYATDDSSNILTNDTNMVYSNNYEYSTIRAWLNSDFYNTAFSSLQKQIIQLTTVDNSVASTGYSSNPYVCDNTRDNVFLLSDAEFDEYITSSAEGQKKITAYAQHQGAYTYSDGSYDGNGFWWLRSPNDDSGNYARGVNCDGYASLGSVYDTSCGIAPALWITL